MAGSPTQPPWAPEELYEKEAFVAPAPDQQETLVIDQSRTRGLRAPLVLPTLFVVLGSAGIASVLLAWLLLHKLQGSLGDVWRQGAFLLDEGTKLEGGLQSARLTGLIITSAAALVVSITTPFLMSLYAFRIAYLWLLQMQRADAGGDDSELPTPLQFGLLVNLLGASSLMSLYETARYFSYRIGQRARATSILTRAFLMCLLAYTVTHAVGATDLWLHSVTSTVIQLIAIPEPSPFPFGFDETRCPPIPPTVNYSVGYTHCLWQPEHWLGDVPTGMQVNTNSSDKFQTITLADADDLAVLVYPNVAQNLQFSTTTFGARASCQSLNKVCQGDQYSGAKPNCSAIGLNNFPVADEFNQFNVAKGGSFAYMLTADCPTCNYTLQDLFDNFNVTQEPTNPFSILIQFFWVSDGETRQWTNVSDAVSVWSDVGSSLANCSLTFYNVSLSYYNGSYIRDAEEPSNTGLADGLAGPTRLSHYANHLLANYEGHVFSETNSTTLMNFLQADLARLALGSSASITNITVDTTSQSTLRQTLVGRYPIVPSVIFILLLYLYAAVALTIFIWTALFTREYAIRDPATRRPVSILELTHLRLTDPVALLATAFPSRNPAANRAVLSLQTEAMDMFDERQLGADSRIRVGVHPSEVDGTSVFGIWRRNGGSAAFRSDKGDFNYG